MNREALETLLGYVEAGTLHDQPYGGMPLCSACYAETGGVHGPWNDAAALGAYHGAIDGAKALHDKLLPGWSYLLGHVGAEDSGAMVFSDPHADLDEVECVETDNAARSWLAAILKALIAESDQ